MFQEKSNYSPCNSCAVLHNKAGASATNEKVAKFPRSPAIAAGPSAANRTPFIRASSNLNLTSPVEPRISPGFFPGCLTTKNRPNWPLLLYPTPPLYPLKPRKRPEEIDGSWKRLFAGLPHCHSWRQQSLLRTNTRFQKDWEL